MDIIHRQHGRKWIAEVWEEANDGLGNMYREPYSEDQYKEINQWCIERFGYHARTAHHIFEFKKQSDLDWFLLRWA